MPRRDRFHQAVKNALDKEGWIITHDPYIVKYGDLKLQIDLGAHMPLAAERNGKKIAIEIKSFLGDSTFQELYLAVGQFGVYRTLIAKKEEDRTLYLAVPDDFFAQFLDGADGRDVCKELNIKLFIYNAETEEIRKWIE